MITKTKWHNINKRERNKKVFPLFLLVFQRETDDTATIFIGIPLFISHPVTTINEWIKEGRKEWKFILKKKEKKKRRWQIFVSPTRPTREKPEEFTESGGEMKFLSLYYYYYDDDDDYYNIVFFLKEKALTRKEEEEER